MNPNFSNKSNNKKIFGPLPPSTASSIFANILR